MKSKNYIIKVAGVTKNYGKNRGNFNISLNIEKGKTLGIIGVNGAGKTTLLRQLMGFIKSDSGSCTINGYDCWKDSAIIKASIGYIPGEIAFPQLKTGMTFLKTQAQFLNVTDLKPTQDMINKFAFDINANLKRMSKGMKQKTAIVESFMSSPDILIFDEPSTGLDPLMENVFIEYIKQQKSLGKTIIMSSHIFEEIEECCDEVVMLNEGKVIEHIEMEKIHHNPLKTYRIGLKTKKEYAKILHDKKFIIKNSKDASLQVFVNVYDKDINTLIKNLLHYDIAFITEIKYTLEEHFLTRYQHIIKK